MIVWCQKDDITIISDKKPITQVRKPLPSDSKAIKKHKKKYPYLNKRQVTFLVIYLGKKYSIVIKKGFKWNGTNCLGLQHYPKLLDSSMVHDACCNNHELVEQDRQLSSIIFREMGIASDVNKAFMWGAYHAVDNFQKIWGRDLRGEKWK